MSSIKHVCLSYEFIEGQFCLKESTTYLGIWYKHFWAIYLAMKRIFWKLIFRVGIWYKHFWAICLAMKSIFWKLIFRVGRRNPKGLASYPLKRLSGKGLIRTSQEYIRGGKFEMMRMIVIREMMMREIRSQIWNFNLGEPSLWYRISQAWPSDYQLQPWAICLKSQRLWFSSLKVWAL